MANEKALRTRCFVIMPFSETSKKHTKEYWTSHFESFLKPLVEGCGDIEAFHSEPLREDILRQIISELVICPVVVADLTDVNPNVFWELGVRQSFKHGTVTIAEDGTTIPFDISAKGILYYYPKDHIKNAKFIKKFKRAIGDCLSHPDRPDSHVLETISGRGTLFEIIRRDEVARRVEALISEWKENHRVMGTIYRALKKKANIPAERLRSPSVELLITHRYLDESPSFYELAEGYFETIMSTNERLVAWLQNPESTITWLKEAKKQIYRNSKSFKRELDAMQKKIAVIC